MGDSRDNFVPEVYFLKPSVHVIGTALVKNIRAKKHVSDDLAHGLSGSVCKSVGGRAFRDSRMLTLMERCVFKTCRWREIVKTIVSERLIVCYF